jgi:pyridoxine 5-phosphate synthase
MMLLGVNIDHAATVRQARYKSAAGAPGGAVEPDPVVLALLCERAGADGITVHLREDRRHIQDRDVWRLREAMATRLNLEMAVTPAMTELALKLKPDSVCLVPENRQEVTTEGGLDIVGGRDRVRACVDAMNAAGIKTSLFIDPDEAQITAAAEVQAPWIELHTGAYAEAYGGARPPGALGSARAEAPNQCRVTELQRLRQGSALAHRAGLVVNAGHGINYVNIAEVRTIPHLHELNIGHSIISRALFTGIEEAVKEMKRRMAGGTAAA